MPRLLGPALAAILLTTTVPALTAASADATAKPRAIGLGESYLSPDGVRIALRGRAEDGAVDKHQARLVVSDDSTKVRAWIPAGQEPEAWTRILDLGQTGPGYLVEQSGGDWAALSVYVVAADGVLKRAKPNKKVALGSGVTTLDGEFAGQRTWIKNGELRTRIQQDDGGKRVVYRWSVTGPGEGGGSDDVTPRLVPERVK